MTEQSSHQEQLALYREALKAYRRDRDVHSSRVRNFRRRAHTLSVEAQEAASVRLEAERQALAARKAALQTEEWELLKNG